MWACAAAVVAVLVGTGVVRADRAAVEAVMADMTKAVLAGDQKGYLSHVATDDPIFLKEQQNWAKDLGLHVPVEFTLTVVEGDKGKDADFGEDRARFQMSMKWRMGEDAQGFVGSVSYPVVFGRQGGVWEYRGEDWVVLEAPGQNGEGGARAMCTKGFEGAAKAAVAVLPAVRAHVDAGFGVHIERVQEVKIYPTMRHLMASIYLSYRDGLEGWNEPGESIKILARNAMGEDELRPLLAHEYGHVATFELGPKASDMPWWVLEGVAELAAQEYRAGSWETVQRLCVMWDRQGALAPWEAMADFRKTEKRWMPNVYMQGHHVLGYISKRWDRGARNMWLTAMAQGKTIDEATREVMGMSFADLDAQWRADLDAQVEAQKKERAGEPVGVGGPGK